MHMSKQNNTGLSLLSDSTDISTLTRVVVDSHNIQKADVAILQHVLSMKADSSTLNSNVASLTSLISNNLSSTNTDLATKANSSDVNTSLAGKQPKLTLQANGAGVPIIYGSYNIRNILAVSPIETLSYVDPFAPSDNRNSNTQISIDLSTYATQTYVSTQINNLVIGSPALLNTLKEIDDALGKGANCSASIATSLAGKQPLITPATDLNIHTLVINGSLSGSAITTLQTYLLTNLTASSPLSILNYRIAINLTGYQTVLQYASGLSLASLIIYGIGGVAKAAITSACQTIGNQIILT